MSLPVHRPAPAGVRLLLAAIAGGAVLLGFGAAPASATVTGGCQGSGTIDANHYDAAQLDPASPITIPAEADVAYQGSVPLPAGTDRAYSGHIDLQLPLGGRVTVADWGGTSKKTGDTGVFHYSVPSVVPRGVTIRAEGSHTQAGLPAPCTGAFAVKLHGGPLDSPVPTAVAGLGTLLAGAGLVSAAFPKGVKP